MQKLTYVIFLFFIFNGVEALSHPPGLIFKAACGLNQPATSNSIVNVCLGNVGAGGLHSSGAPETILTLFLDVMGDDGKLNGVALPVIYGIETDDVGKQYYVLKYVMSDYPVKGRQVKLLKFKLEGNEHNISGIKGVATTGEEVNVVFDSSVDATFITNQK